jgi:hypothetical protein
MIVRSTGEVSFEGRLRVSAHAPIAEVVEGLPPTEVVMQPLPIEGWRQYSLGEHAGTLGVFRVEAVTGPERRVEAVFLSHCHSFYETASPGDSERRAFHEGVIASELAGQREFPWGHVFCRLDAETPRDWLVVIYSPFSAVPLQRREVYRVLFEYEGVGEG